MSEHAVGRIKSANGTFVVIFFDDGIGAYEVGALYLITGSAEDGFDEDEDGHPETVVLAWESQPGKVELFGGGNGAESLRTFSWNQLRRDHLIPLVATVNDAREVSFKTGALEL